jgi:hypothetical protein
LKHGEAAGQKGRARQKQWCWWLLPVCLYEEGKHSPERLLVFFLYFSIILLVCVAMSRSQTSNLARLLAPAQA